MAFGALAVREGERRLPHSRQLLRICGLAAVTALFDRDPRRVERLFFEDRLKGEVGSFCRTLAQARKPYRQVDKAELARIAGTPLHGSVVAIATPQPLADFDRNAARIWARNRKPLLVLDGIGNPHNLGAIARSATFFGLGRPPRPGAAVGCGLPRGGRWIGALGFVPRTAPGRSLRTAGGISRDRHSPRGRRAA